MSPPRPSRTFSRPFQAIRNTRSTPPSDTLLVRWEWRSAAGCSSWQLPPSRSASGSRSACTPRRTVPRRCAHGRWAGRARAPRPSQRLHQQAGTDSAPGMNPTHVPPTHPSGSLGADQDHDRHSPHNRQKDGQTNATHTHTLPQVRSELTKLAQSGLRRGFANSIDMARPLPAHAAPSRAHALAAWLDPVGAHHLV